MSLKKNVLMKIDPETMCLELFSDGPSMRLYDLLSSVWN